MLKRSSRLKRHFKAHFLIKLVFRIMLNKRTDKAGKVVYTILKYKVSKRYKVLMLAVATSLTGVGGVVFWDYFIFEDSYICSTDPNLACFPAFPNLTTLRLDCSDTSYLEINNITSIICYRYSFTLGSATGGALGVVTTYALVFIIKTLLLLKVSNGSEWTKCRAVLTVAIQITIVVTIFSIAIPVYTFLALNSYTIEKKIIRIMISGSIVFTIIYSTVLFPWWSFEKMKDIKKDIEDNTEYANNGECRRV